MQGAMFTVVDEGTIGKESKRCFRRTCFSAKVTFFFISMKSTIYMHYIIFIIRLFFLYIYIKKGNFFFHSFLFSFQLSLTLLNDMCHEFYRECAGLQPSVIQVF